MELKDTLLMPKTEFEMRGNLTKKDPVFIFKTEQLVKTINKFKNSDTFILHDGPPYANGDIHVGHALNKILKDIVVRDQLLRGRPIDWRPGWDAHGLPIENQIQKNGIKLSEIGKEKYLKEAAKYALFQVEKQEKQFKSLNLMADFENKYITFEPKFEKAEIEIFHSMLNQGLTYQDLKPVYWSWSSETALAEAEIEYQDIEDNSIFVKFKLDDLNLIIWTTTPWTLPANVAIAFGKDISYGVYEYNDEKIVIANSLISNIESKLKVNLKKQSEFNPREIIGKDAINPLTKNKSKLVWGHHVTIEGGTGLVHIAGGHGLDDFQIVKENNLDLVVVMDDKGHMQNSAEFDGLFYLKANKLIIEALGDSLLHYSILTHSVPIDWRTKKPVVYRATKQWFVSIKSIKDQIIENASTVKWLPEWGKDRIIGMTENRDDWGISRQRLWGVPIPIIYDSNNEPIIDLKLQKNIEDLFEKEGTLGWHRVEIKDLLPESINFEEGMRKETDILDVWFDSGSSHNALGIKTSDLYLEGNDQYRGWFNSSLITSTVINQQAPYKKVITHGFVTDGQGNKMSKSVGNTIDPLKITAEQGSDILRLWVGSSNYTDNIRISDDIIKQVSNDYRKIRNTIRFMLGNIYDFEATTEPTKQISKAVLSEIAISWKKINNALKQNDYVTLIKEVMNQLTSGAISYYNELAKNIVYVHAKNSNSRREAQYVINEGLKFLLYALASIIPATIEEAFEYMGNKTSIFLTEYPTFKSYEFEFNIFRNIKEAANKVIEELKEDKKIKRSQEVELDISLPFEYSQWKDDLNNLLLVAKVNLIDGDELKITGKTFNGHKCERCWKLFDYSLNEERLCFNCAKVIKGLSNEKD